MEPDEVKQEQELELPAWLVPNTHDQKFPRTKDHRDLTRMLYESMFERVLDGLESGELAIDIVQNDPREIDYGKFMSWINRDPERKNRFLDAKKNATPIWQEKALIIAMGKNGLEDVQRSKLAVDTIWKSMQVDDRERYGSDKNSNGNGDKTVNITISQVESPYKQIATGVTIDG